MTDSWQTVPVKHRSWVSPSGPPAATPIFGTRTFHEDSTFRSKQGEGRFDAFGSRTENGKDRVIPDAFSSKKGGAHREQEDQRRQWQAKVEFEAQRIRQDEEQSLRDALTIESEKEYPSLQPSSPESPAMSRKGTSLLNFKAVMEAPPSPVPKVMVIGNGKPQVRSKTPPPIYYDEEEEGDDWEFNAHIGSGRRGGGGDGWQ
jgi:hypothetical protein